MMQPRTNIINMDTVMDVTLVDKNVVPKPEPDKPALVEEAVLIDTRILGSQYW